MRSRSSRARRRRSTAWAASAAIRICSRSSAAPSTARSCPRRRASHSRSSARATARRRRSASAARSSIGEKQGGYFVYGLLENSDTFVEPVHVEQKLVQAGVSIDDAIGNFRLEVGTQLQNSNTAGAFMTRVTQDLIDNGKYIRGVPLVNLDVNGDGQIGYHETHLGSPVLGRPVSGNEPLGQDFRWPDRSAPRASLTRSARFPSSPAFRRRCTTTSSRSAAASRARRRLAPTRRACCARKASAAPCRSRAGCPSASRSIRARSAYSGRRLSARRLRAGAERGSRHLLLRPRQRRRRELHVQESVLLRQPR